MAPSIGTDSQELKPLIHELDLVDEIGELGKDLVALHGINISMLSGDLNAYMTALNPNPPDPLPLLLPPDLFAIPFSTV